MAVPVQTQLPSQKPVHRSFRLTKQTGPNFFYRNRHILLIGANTATIAFSVYHISSKIKIDAHYKIVTPVDRNFSEFTKMHPINKHVIPSMGDELDAGSVKVRL